jgi:hypothetical protein
MDVIKEKSKITSKIVFSGFYVVQEEYPDAPLALPAHLRPDLGMQLSGN